MSLTFFVIFNCVNSVGLVELSKVNSPSSFSPQPHIVPSFFITKVVSSFTITFFTLSILGT